MTASTSQPEHDTEKLSDEGYTLLAVADDFLSRFHGDDLDADAVYDWLVAQARTMQHPSAPMEPPTVAQHVIQRESIEDALENDRCGNCLSVDHFREDCPTPPADAPEQQDDERPYAAWVETLPGGSLPGYYETFTAGWCAALASRRPAEADQQRRQDVGQRVLNVMLTSGHPPNSGALALAIADALLSAPAGPAGRDDAQ